VLYTDFNPSGKLRCPDPQELAIAAIKSVERAELGKDGISYLIDRINEGILTGLTPRYEKEILALTGTPSLAEALASTRAELRKR